MLPWWIGDVGKVKLFLLPSPMHPVLDFLLLQWCVGTSLLDCWSSTKTPSHPQVIVSVSVLQGLSWPQLRGAGASSRVTSGSKSRTKFSMLITQCTMAEIPVGPLAYGAGYHSFLKAFWSVGG